MADGCRRRPLPHHNDTLRVTPRATDNGCCSDTTLSGCHITPLRIWGVLYRTPACTYFLCKPVRWQNFRNNNIFTFLTMSITIRLGPKLLRQNVYLGSIRWFRIPDSALARCLTKQLDPRAYWIFRSKSYLRCRRCLLILFCCFTQFNFSLKSNFILHITSSTSQVPRLAWFFRHIF